MAKSEMKRTHGATLSVTVGRNGNRVHRLIDDIAYPVRASCIVVRRDPMVEALFGAPGARRMRKSG